jgi:transposase
MERDLNALQHGYTAWSYCRALKKGLLRNYYAGDLFQQDNAPIHTARVTMDFLREHRIRVVNFPPYLLDLNPIEHMWWMLKRVLHRLHPKLDNIRRSAED